MTKLADILNDCYLTEGITVKDHIKAICAEVEKSDMDSELQSLFVYLDKTIK